MERIEDKSKKKCNGCRCSFAEMVELFYWKVISELKNDNADVHERLKNVLTAVFKARLRKMMWKTRERCWNAVFTATLFAIKI